MMRKMPNVIASSDFSPTTLPHPSISIGKRKDTMRFDAKFACTASATACPRTCARASVVVGGGGVAQGARACARANQSARFSLPLSQGPYLKRENLGDERPSDRSESDLVTPNI